MHLGQNCIPDFVGLVVWEVSVVEAVTVQDDSDQSVGQKNKKRTLWQWANDTINGWRCQLLIVGI